jgi:hypothetical protein
VKTLTAIRRDLERIAKVLSGQDEGIRQMPDVQLVADLASILA